MATSLQWPLFLSRRTFHTFSLILTSLQRSLTSPQWQRPLKFVPTGQNDLLTTAINQQLTKDAYKTSFFIVKGHQTWSVLRVIGLCFCCIDTFWFIYATINIFENKRLQPRKKGVMFTSLPPHNGQLSTIATFLCLQGDRCGEVRL